jgi:hypothetical protein
MPTQRRAEKQINPDAELTRAFGVGCMVLLVAFLLLSVAVYYFWTN